MANLVKVEVPDIGDFKDVSVIEVLVKPGDEVEQETSLIALETDKASIEVPSPHAGIVKEMHVKVGDKVSQGSLIVTLEAAVSAVEEAAIQANASNPAIATASETQPAMSTRGAVHAEVVVLGAGPGGYTAAFRAADLGKQVVLIERYPTLGGVCLNVGCIPSKALLHVAKVITEAKEIEQQGIVFGKPKVAIDQLRSWKESVVGKLTKGLAALARQRKVDIIQGSGKFVSPHMIEVNTAEGVTTVSFDHCIIAAGSTAARIPGFPYDDPRLMDSTDALELADIPKRMLVIGGGIIGLEMATVYDALGSQISIVEQMDQLIPGADSDLVKPLHKHLVKRYEAIYLNTKVSKIEAGKKGLNVFFEGSHAPAPQLYDRILVAVGRRPNGRMIAAEQANVQVNERGFIPVDTQMRTNVPHIFAIGDITGEPMLAHKATYEGKLAAEAIAGHKVAFDALTIPSVAYTDPEIAWMGLTEIEARKKGIDYEKAIFPWAASGRATAMGRDEGFTKLLLDKNSRRILGAGIVGVHAGELIAEVVLALEMGADMQDIGLTIHPHPTLSETILFSAEIAEGTITDLYMPKR
ncbi:dihydrolipoyl dehydrogenase [Nitrosomonas communis]|uniref:dihydrolipoyl dehydrogenase n=1 Tax=Nitrosomonas communis TaxID=44574 RepID=UPI0026EE1DFA|nr:dihydrolipoyl dehydrogenase [Nitrosomonas communis]MCO6426955.1 dihydrolipoyl dehydrogenase [Nitrosomonas communis]